MKSRRTASLIALLLVSIFFGAPSARIIVSQVLYQQVLYEKKAPRVEQVIAVRQKSRPVRVAAAIYPRREFLHAANRSHSLFQRPPPAPSL